MNAAIDIKHNHDKTLLHPEQNHDIICIRRSDLETEHRQLLSRIQQLRRLLGYDPLPTGKQRRLQIAE